MMKTLLDVDFDADDLGDLDDLMILINMIKMMQTMKTTMINMVNKMTMMMTMNSGTPTTSFARPLAEATLARAFRPRCVICREITTISGRTRYW
jgi:hypothetical protein